MHLMQQRWKGTKRPRRLRVTPAMRAMVREVRLDPSDLVYPLFVMHGTNRREPIPSMPGIFRWSVDRVVSQVRDVRALGVPAVLLFGLPRHKDSMGSEAYADDGVVQSAVRAIKNELDDVVVITDTCLCEYTDHGHCGIVAPSPYGGANDVQFEAGYVLNDETLDLLGRIAVSQAAAGADVVAPSGMLDGMVAAIRSALDDADFDRVAILSYSAKYASGFYGPFRDAADGAPQWGDRRSHQMDPANAAEAMKEMSLDVREGADVVMVKPALSYLDIVRRAKKRFADIPIAAYNVSGEYSMVKAAAANQWLDERAVVLEILTSIKRAGADIIISYHAADVAGWLAGEG